MQQTKEKAPCTTAIVQSAKAKTEPKEAQEKNITKEAVSQLWTSTDDLRCLKSINLDEIQLVMSDAIGTFGQDVICIESAVIHDRMTYYCAVFSMIYREYHRAIEDISTIIRDLEQVHTCLKGVCTA